LIRNSVKPILIETTHWTGANFAITLVTPVPVDLVAIPMVIKSVWAVPLTTARHRTVLEAILV
jgi:hypothetical protein